MTCRELQHRAAAVGEHLDPEQLGRFPVALVTIALDAEPPPSNTQT